MHRDSEGKVHLITHEGIQICSHLIFHVSIGLSLCDFHLPLSTSLRGHSAVGVNVCRVNVQA